MDNACWTMNYCSLCVDLHFLYIHFMHSLAHAVRLQIAILATTLSSMAAGYVSQTGTTPVQIIHVF